MLELPAIEPQHFTWCQRRHVGIGAPRLLDYKSSSCGLGTAILAIVDQVFHGLHFCFDYIDDVQLPQQLSLSTSHGAKEDTR